MEYEVVHVARNWLDKPSTPLIYDSRQFEIITLLSGKKEKEKGKKTIRQPVLDQIRICHFRLFNLIKSTRSGACRYAVR